MVYSCHKIPVLPGSFISWLAVERAEATLRDMPKFPRRWRIWNSSPAPGISWPALLPADQSATDDFWSLVTREGCMKAAVGTWYL